MHWKFYLAASILVPATAIIVAPPLFAEAANSEIAITPPPEWAQASDPAPVPDDAQGVVYFRKQDTHVRLTKNGQRTYVGQIARILQPQALELGNIAIAWNPSAGQAEVHAVRIYRGNRVIDVLQEASFEILRREDQLEQAMLDGMLTAVLKVPDLRVGDDIELAYSVPANDPTLLETSYGMMLLGDNPPEGHFTLSLSWEDGQKPKTQMSADLEKIANRSNNAIKLTFAEPEIVSIPRNSPPRFGWPRMLEFSDFEDWEAVSRRFYPYYSDAAQLNQDSPLKEEAAIIAETHSDDLSRAQAALDLVQRQIRYIYIGLNGQNYLPATADETWQRRYGDCKGKTVMLMALLNELDIKSETVLVSNIVSTDGLETRLAGPGHFDHILVRATIDGKTYWMDGTLPPVVPGTERPFLPYEAVLPLSEAGSSLEKVSQAPYDIPQSMMLTDIDASAGFKEPAKRSHTFIRRGLSGLEQYGQFSALTANQIEAAFRNQLIGTSEWNTLESVTWRYDSASQASILSIIGTGPVKWEDEEDGGYFLRLPNGGFNPPNRRLREAEGDSAIPFYQARDYTCDVTTIHLPNNTDMKNWDFNSVIDVMMYGEIYYRMMELRDDRTLRLLRSSRVETSEISAERAARDNGRLERFDNSMAILYYLPGEISEEWEGGQPVPAVTEIDWTAPGAPCLPPDVLKE